MQYGVPSFRTTESANPGDRRSCAKVMQRIQFYALICILAVTSSVLSINEQAFGDMGFSVSIRAANTSAVGAVPNASPLLNFGEAASCYRSYERSATSITTPLWRLCHPSKTLSDSDYEPFTGTSIFRTIQRIGPGLTYKECDGITRFSPSPDAASICSTYEVSLTYRGWDLGNWTTKCESSLPEPSTVTCSVPEAFCEGLWASYRSADQIFAKTEQIQTKPAPGRPVYPCGAPGECQLDLQQEIVLLYWPPKLTSRDICMDDGIGTGKTAQDSSASAVKTITKIPFRGVDMYRLSWVSKGRTLPWKDPIVDPSVLKGHWVVTSPTILLAHRPITAYNYSRQDGSGQADTDRNETKVTIREAGVIYLQSQDLYSSRPLLFKSNGGSDLAYKIANGLWRPEPGQLLAGENIQYEIKPFDFGHIQNPVPASVYFDARNDCWGEQTHCATITDGTYRPKLLIGGNVWRRVLSSYFYCNWPSVVDPPIALEKIDEDSGPPSPQLPEFPALITPNSVSGENSDHRIWKAVATPRPASRLFERPGPRATAGSQPGEDQSDEAVKNRGDDAPTDTDSLSFSPSPTEAAVISRTRSRNGQNRNLPLLVNWLLPFAMFTSFHLL
jgi:hypothetical protein